MKPTFAVVVVLLAASCLSGQESSPDGHRAAVEKGLAWLVKQQQADGSFTYPKSDHSTVSTAMGGLALLMEGSTLNEGKYAEHLRKTSDFLVKRCQKGEFEGLIADPKDSGDAGRYMYGHAFAMLFLASAFANEDDSERRRELRDVLIRAVQFSEKAQSTNGGWFYTSVEVEGYDSDAGSVTLCQIQALQAAYLAGIPVPRAMLKNALRRLGDQIREAKNPGGGQRGEDPLSLSAGAVACRFTAGDYQSDQVKKYLKYCARLIPNRPYSLRWQYSEFTRFYYGQIPYGLGEKYHRRIFPDAEQCLQWSNCRANFFSQTITTQDDNGGWGDGTSAGGPVFRAAVNLIILQMENEAIPIFATRIPIR